VMLNAVCTDMCMLLFFVSFVVIVVNQRKVKFFADYVISCNGEYMLFAHVAQKLDALQSSR